MQLSRPLPTGRRQRGLSLVELMVGITVGMIVVAGASLLMVNQLDDNRRLTLEVQVQQDLRAAADLMLRDLRRAAYNSLAEQTIWAVGADAPVTNGYRNVTVSESKDSVTYSYSRTSPEDNVVEDSEKFGFKLASGTLMFQLGSGNWQPLTDPNVLTITGFTVAMNSQSIDVSEFCTKPCETGADCPPKQSVRNVVLTLSAQAVHDAKVQRTVTVGARMRNDDISGGC